MKLECHVLSVEDVGDKLLVKMQGSGLAEGEAGRLAAQHLAVPADKRSRKAFYVGRKATIDVRLK